MSVPETTFFLKFELCIFSPAVCQKHGGLTQGRQKSVFVVISAAVVEVPRWNRLSMLALSVGSEHATGLVSSQTLNLFNFFNTTWLDEVTQYFCGSSEELDLYFSLFFSFTAFNTWLLIFWKKKPKYLPLMNVRLAVFPAAVIPFWHLKANFYKPTVSKIAGLWLQPLSIICIEQPCFLFNIT